PRSAAAGDAGVRRLRVRGRRPLARHLLGGRRGPPGRGDRDVRLPGAGGRPRVRFRPGGGGGGRRCVRREFAAGDGFFGGVPGDAAGWHLALPADGGERINVECRVNPGIFVWYGAAHASLSVAKLWLASEVR